MSAVGGAVVKLPSGVQYFDVRVGEGAEAQVGKTVQFQVGHAHHTTKQKERSCDCFLPCLPLFS